MLKCTGRSLHKEAFILLAQARSSGEYISTLQRGEGGDDKVCVFDNRLLFHKHRSEKTGCNKVEISKRTNVFHKKLAGRHLCVSLLGSRLFWVSVLLSRQWLLLLDSLTAIAAPCWSGLTIVSLRLSLTLSLSLYPSLSLSLSLSLSHTGPLPPVPFHPPVGHVYDPACF